MGTGGAEDCREKELKAFDETKAGVKGLVDAGMVNIPKIFVRPPDELTGDSDRCQIHCQVPVIDFDGVDGDRHKEIVNQLKSASECWGFFQVVNHGIPLQVLEDMIKGTTRFHEGDVEMKKVLYSRDRTRRVRFNSNYDLYNSKAASWRDTLTITLPSNELDPQELPPDCRECSIQYVKHVSELGHSLLKLLSEALGLNSEHLVELGCGKRRTFVCHYYPPCPQPELTLGTTKHSDPSFLTILLQDQIGGLQVLHQNQWVDVQPIPGALIVNIGDFLQIMSNGKLKSVEHRVLAKSVGPRISVACFLTGEFLDSKVYGPVKELLSENNPPLYRDFTISEYLATFFSSALDVNSKTDSLKL
ncbi:1-aminocyclopropane-1-carboxylate oxidase homolog 1-like [Carica papaya]|uniref:1-aminocyclopropane-1-carboxylate oxidase homolog 1-like n=1 Tax=Carica papaya TaxID=3649 RepID=UPI000B8CBC9D|nr:1-aminocyclopropane-1-carboxylate oxidase homolog 1-like [Carica papaya]